MALTPKQQQFVLEYLKDLNATQAAIRAGYAPKDADVQGPRLLGNVGVMEAINKAKEKRAAKIEIDAEWVLRRLVEISDRCMQAEPVRDDEGNPTGEYLFNAAGANKATELVGKHIRVTAFASDKMELTGKDGGPIEIAELSDTERAAKLASILAVGEKRKQASE